MGLCLESQAKNSKLPLLEFKKNNIDLANARLNKANDAI